ELRLELRKRSAGEGGDEQGDVCGSNVPHAAVQEAPFEDVPGGPAPHPLAVVEPGRVVPDVEDHAGLEEGIEEIVEGLDRTELLRQEEGFELGLFEDLAGFVLPLE